MTIEQILIPGAAVLATVSLNAWINTKIKFSKDQPEAMRSIRSVLLLVVIGACQVYTAITLYLELNSSAPLTRHSLASILFDCFALFTVFMFYWINSLLRQIGRLVDMDGKILNVLRDALESQETFPRPKTTGHGTLHAKDNTPSPTLVTHPPAADHATPRQSKDPE